MSNYDNNRVTWEEASIPTPGDFNRIESNIDYFSRHCQAHDINMENNGSCNMSQAKIWG